MPKNDGACCCRELDFRLSGRNMQLRFRQQFLEDPGKSAFPG